MEADSFSVVIAGGGVAALEAALTLRELGEGRIRVELLAPEPSFWYRPVAVAEPFDLGEVRHFDLGQLAEGIGAFVTLGSLTGVDVDRREARTASDAVLRYDALLLACGAVPEPAVAGALTFRGPADSPRMRELLGEIERGEVAKVAFAVPPLAASERDMPERNALRALFAEVARRGGCEVWDFAALSLPEAYFRDVSHLNREGRAQYSEALAHELVRLLKAS